MEENGRKLDANRGGGMIRMLAQVWFGLSFVITLVFVRVVCEAIHLIPGLNKRTKEMLSMQVMAYSMKVFLLFQIQIGVYYDYDKIKLECESIDATLARGQGVAIMINHTSKLDGFLAAAILPAHITARCKSFMAGNLFNAVLAGRIFTLIGHLPVHFKSDDYSKFTVDKEKQMKVVEEMEHFLKKGKILMYCPEGRINKNPEKLSPFRHGSFKIVHELNLQIWLLAVWNSHKVWPYGAAMGGFPTDLKISLNPLTPEKNNEKESKIEENNGEDAIPGVSKEKPHVKLSQKSFVKMEGIIERLRSGDPNLRDALLGWRVVAGFQIFAALTYLRYGGHALSMAVTFYPPAVLTLRELFSKQLRNRHVSNSSEIDTEEKKNTYGVDFWLSYWLIFTFIVVVESIVSMRDLVRSLMSTAHPDIQMFANVKSYSTNLV